jgi:hypothetical protein
MIPDIEGNHPEAWGEGALDHAEVAGGTEQAVQ